MLSRYRSVADTALVPASDPPSAAPVGGVGAAAAAAVDAAAAPPYLNNPVFLFAHTEQFRNKQLAARMGLPGEQLLATRLRVWSGPLAGVAHQAGQFAALQEGPEGDAAPQPPDELAKELAHDLDLLASLAEALRGVAYDASGSESEFAVLPVILEPRLPVPQGGSSDGSSCSSTAGAAAAPPAAATEGAAEQQQPSALQECSSVSAWWSLPAARATRLTAAEVASSLGVAPQLVAQLQAPLECSTPSDFWRHMHDRHITRLAGGAEGDEGDLAAVGGEAPQDSTDDADAGVGMDGAWLSPRRTRAAFAGAVRLLRDNVSYPVVQLTLGSEALAWNPIPLMWLGRSRRSGAILGLLTAVVWT